jgi:hypothetical protein
MQAKPQWGVLGAPQTGCFRRSVFGQSRKIRFFLRFRHVVWMATAAALKEKATAEKVDCAAASRLRKSSTLSLGAAEGAAVRLRNSFQIVVMAVKNARQHELAAADEPNQLGLLALTEQCNDDEMNGDPATPPTQETPRAVIVERTSRVQRRIHQLHQIAAGEAAMAKDFAWSADTAENFRRAFAVLQQQSLAHESSVDEIHTEIDAALAMSKLLCKCMGINLEQSASASSVKILEAGGTQPQQHRISLSDILRGLQSTDEASFVEGESERHDCFEMDNDFKCISAEAQGAPPEINDVLQAAAPAVRQKLRLLLEWELKKNDATDRTCQANNDHADSMPAWCSALEIVAKVAIDGSLEDGAVAALETALLSAGGKLGGRQASNQSLRDEFGHVLFERSGGEGVIALEVNGLDASRPIPSRANSFKQSGSFQETGQAEEPTVSCDDPPARHVPFDGGRSTPTGESEDARHDPTCHQQLQRPLNSNLMSVARNPSQRPHALSNDGPGEAADRDSVDEEGLLSKSQRSKAMVDSKLNADLSSRVDADSTPQVNTQPTVDSMLKNDSSKATVVVLAGLAAAVGTRMHTVETSNLPVASCTAQDSLAVDERKLVEIRNCLALGEVKETANTPKPVKGFAALIDATTHSARSASESHKPPCAGQAMQSSASAGNVIKYSDANSDCPPFPDSRQKQHLSMRSTSPMSPSGSRRQRIGSSSQYLIDNVQPASAVLLGRQQIHPSGHISSKSDALNARGQSFRAGRDCMPQVPQRSSSGASIRAIRDKRHSAEHWSCSPRRLTEHWSIKDFAIEPAASWCVSSMQSASTSPTQSAQSGISPLPSWRSLEKGDERVRDVERKGSTWRSASLTSPRSGGFLPTISSGKGPRKVVHAPIYSSKR